MKKLLFLLPLLLFTPLAFAESANVGIIYWKQDIVSSNSFAEIYVKDNDMNKKEYPNFADKFMITVWSDSSPDGLEIQVVETGVYTGIFKGTVYVADSGESTKNRLIAYPGEILYAKYTDSTLPTGGTSDVISAAVVKISGENMDKILEKIDPSMRPSSEDNVPAWVKNNAGWWAEGTISDGEFVNGIQHLMKTGLISVILNEKPEEMISPEPQNTDSKLAALEAELEACSEIVKAYKRIDCQKPIEKEIALYNYKMNAKSFEVGPITYYWNGVGSEGNEFQISPTGQAILSIRMLAENTSSEIVGLNCTSPQICAYDVWDGSKAFKYSGMDFTSGQINLNPNDSKEFNILFGPNIGYGGTQFQYDSSKNYEFRISENFGSVSVPLNLK